MSDEMPKLKITVLQRSFNAELVKEYSNAGAGYTACDQLQVGQEFVTDQP